MKETLLADLDVTRGHAEFDAAAAQNAMDARQNGYRFAANDEKFVGAHARAQLQRLIGRQKATRNVCLFRRPTAAGCGDPTIRA